MDGADKRILKLLQANCNLSLNEISEQVNLSRNACWNRVRQLEAHGVIRRRVALLDREHLNLDLTVLIAVRTNRHDADWLSAFKSAVKDLPNSGDLPHHGRDRLHAARRGAEHESL